VQLPDFATGSGRLAHSPPALVILQLRLRFVNVARDALHSSAAQRIFALVIIRFFIIFVCFSIGIQNRERVIAKTTEILANNNSRSFSRKYQRLDLVIKAEENNISLLNTSPEESLKCIFFGFTFFFLLTCFVVPSEYCYRFLSAVGHNSFMEGVEKEAAVHSSGKFLTLRIRSV